MSFGQKAARAIFGNHSEIHLSEAQLAAIIDTTIEFADKTREKQEAQREREAANPLGL